MNNKLLEFIQLLTNNNYQVRKIKSIESDLSFNDPSIMILNDNDFSIEYKTKQDKMILATTFSNKLIDADYIQKINWLYERITGYNY